MGRFTPTKEQLAGGWDEESLRKYEKSRAIAASKIVFNVNGCRDQRPEGQTHKYNPHKWRRGK
jgi:hypothetical protein